MHKALSLILLVSLISSLKAHNSEDPEEMNHIDTSEGSDYQEEEDESLEILTDIKEIEAALKMFPKVFLYITKDNCDYCKSLDPVFESVFRIIQKDRSGNGVMLLFVNIFVFLISNKITKCFNRQHLTNRPA
jgi:thioredoxin-related protein